MVKTSWKLNPGNSYTYKHISNVTQFNWKDHVSLWDIIGKSTSIQLLKIYPFIDELFFHCAKANKITI